MGKGVVWNLARFGLSRRRESVEGGPLIVTLESEEALTNGSEMTGRYYIKLGKAEQHMGRGASY